MTYSHDFVDTIALIATRAKSEYPNLTPDVAVQFAWFSASQVGDASIDDADLTRHYETWLDLTSATV